MNSQKPQKHTNTWLLFTFLKGSLGIFVSGIAVNVLVTFLATLVPQIVSFTVDSVILSGEPQGVFLKIMQLAGGRDFLRGHIYLIALAIAVIALLGAILSYVSLQLNTIANERMMKRMRVLLFSHIQRLPLSFYGPRLTGDMIQRCTNDAQNILNFVSMQLVPLVRVAATIILSLVFMFLMNVKLALIASVFLPVVIGYSVIFDRTARKRFKKCDEEEGVLSAYAQENLTGVRIVRAFGREKYERDKFERQNSYYTGLWVGLERFLAMFWNTSAFLTALQLMFIVVIGTLYCVRGELSAGDFLAFISYNAMLIAPVKSLGRIISNMAKAGVSLGRINEIMGAQPESYGLPLPLRGDIVLKDVSFGYDPQKTVLQHINLTVPQGSVLGIIGGTGSGKSTLACLLDGLYAPTEGQIYIGGQGLDKISLASLRAHIGLVLQEGYVYSRTVGQNIGIAAEAGEEEIISAARTACLDKDVQNFENGYNTVVGERGVTLSGGQKQRLCIARTLLRNTPVLIFDDSLSAVDAATDAQIRKNLKEEFSGRTVIIISHRITTVMDADNIIVLENGRIAEQGDHKSLIGQGGLYKRIYDLQTGLPEELKGGAE